MTAAKKQAAVRTLAEAMGWRECRTGDGRFLYWWSGPGTFCANPDWNPFTSLDDVRIVEDWLRSRGMWHEYLNALRGTWPSEMSEFSFGVQATAAQRAEACLRVIEGMA